jgi:hypothetical protein
LQLLLLTQKFPKILTTKTNICLKIVNAVGVHNQKEALEMLRCKLAAQLPADASGVDMAIMNDIII